MHAAHQPPRVLPLVVGHDEAAFGRAVALQDHDAEVLPGFLQFRLQVGASEEDELQRTTELGVQGAEHESASPVGEMPSDVSTMLDGRFPPALLDLSHEPAPEELQHLRGHDHDIDVQVTHRLEDDPGVARAHVDDLGPHHRAEEERRDLLQEVRQRQDRDDAQVAVLQQVAEHTHRFEEIAVREQHALGGGRGARGEVDLEERVAVGLRPGQYLRFPVVGPVIVGVGSQLG